MSGWTRYNRQLEDARLQVKDAERTATEARQRLREARQRLQRLERVAPTKTPRT